jgi:ribonuclease R
MARGKSKSGGKSGGGAKSERSGSGGGPGARSKNASSSDRSSDRGGQRGDQADRPAPGSGGASKKREVKNARSLADVLSGNKGRASGASSGTSGRDTARGGSQSSRDRDNSRETDRGSNRGNGREDFSPDRSKGAVSKKLTYIMSFQSPEERAAQAAKQLPPEPVIVKAEVSRPAQRSRFDENPPEKKNSPSRDSFLAKQRSEPVREERSTQHGERADRSEGRGTNKSALKVEARGTNRPAPRFEERGTNKSARPEVQQVRPNQRAPGQRPPGSWPENRVTAKVSDEVVPTETRKGRGGRPDARHVTGLIKRHPDGFGFLIVDQPETPDVYVARQSMTGIMTNDRVEVELYRPRSGGKSKEDRLSGEIIKVLSRANTRVVGRYLPVDKKYGILQDENRGWGADLRIAADDTLGAKEGELIAVEITQYPDDEHEFTGKVVSIIGDSDDPINDVIRIVHQAGIPNEFSKQAIGDAQKFGGKVTDQERRGREDLTAMNLITIDGVTAKDFDDAIHTEQTAKGFLLTVAIADVSHYVKPGSRLDEEAYERGTSTYFPNYVVPMLPEELSNELCSLKPHVPRLCFCCEMNINFNGDVSGFRFFEGVMDSKARVTYGEAQEVIDAYDNGEEAKNKTAKKLAHVSENILRSRDLAKILMAKRFRDGSLDLEIPETQVVVDSTGESTDIIRASRIFAHRLIEELMLVTNICTAKFMDESKIPGIYRVHEEPDQDNIKNLQRFLFNMGGSKSVMGGNLAKKLTAALESVAGKPEAQILNILTLRTMQQAHYSETNVGHFGLGFSHYSHFTSPIRRYPDLIAHRLIKSVIYDRYNGMQMSDEEVASATTWLSATEQRSTKAERKVISIKKARFIKRFVGQEFDGMVSSVAKFGVFVLLRQYDVDGLVKIEKLGNDRFEFDEENLRLVGRKSGLVYTIGDEVKVRVMSADTDTGKVDFELAEMSRTHGDEGADAHDANDAYEDQDESKNRAGGEQKRGQRKDRPGQAPGKGQKHEQKRNQKSFQESNEKPTPGRRGGVAEPEKRGKSANDSRGVRKERVSKRRGKN